MKLLLFFFVAVVVDILSAKLVRNANVCTKET